MAAGVVRQLGDTLIRKMFTGIVEATGTVESLRPAAKAVLLAVRAGRCARGLKIGASVAVNGCCLTVVRLSPRARPKVVEFELLRETWERTNLRFMRAGSRVNLERALRANGRLDGHFVTGHIDGTGTIRRWERVGPDHVLEIAAPPEVMRYVVFKGAIAVDGISLTVAAVWKRSFRVWVIPHTHAVTALRDRQVGAEVNLETDLLGKYVEQFVARRRREKRRAVIGD